MYRDSNMLKYNLFLAEQIEEQGKYEACLNESILIGMGTNNSQNIRLLNESVVDKMKLGIQKILLTLQKIWEKFTEAMATLIKKDKDYLTKYKDTILKKKPINADYNMYDYQKGVSNLLRSTVPAFNYNSMKDELVDKDTFINKYFKKYTLGDDKSNFSDRVKAYFRGSVDQKKINSSQLNMTDIFNYCYTYNKMEDLIHKDLQYIQKAAKDAINLVEKMGREEKIAQESTNLFEQPKYYSLLYEAYITEEEKPGDKNKTNPSNPAASRTVNDGAASNGSKPNEHYKGVNGDKDSKLEEKDVDGSVKVVTDKIKVYLNVCSEFIGAKESIAEEIYKAYMSIIKAHVRDHVGNKDSENKTVDNSTNYSDDNKNTAEENKKKQEDRKDEQEASKVSNEISGMFKKRN